MDITKILAIQDRSMRLWRMSERLMELIDGTEWHLYALNPGFSFCEVGPALVRGVTITEATAAWLIKGGSKRQTRQFLATL